MNIMPDVVDAQLRLRFLGGDVMLPSVMASDSVHMIRMHFRTVTGLAGKIPSPEAIVS
jgi:hypothetical protein